jgi:hypothetical protein
MSNVGQAALIVVGTVVGAYFGNPQLGFVLGSLAGAALFPTQLPAGPQLTDNRTTQATIGTPIPIIFGTASVAGTVIWLAPYVQTTNSGKGGPEQTTYSYTQSIALLLCEAVQDGAPAAIGGVSRIWENGTIVYDIRPQLQADTQTGQVAETDQEYANRLAASAAYAETFVLYLGTEDQLPDPTIEAQQGIGATPAFRGTAYIVYPNRVLQTAQAWRHPNFKFEVYESGTGECTDTTGFSNSVLYPWLYGGYGTDPTNLSNINTWQVHAVDTSGPGYPGFNGSLTYSNWGDAYAAMEAVFEEQLQYIGCAIPGLTGYIEQIDRTDPLMIPTAPPHAWLDTSDPVIIFISYTAAPVPPEDHFYSTPPDPTLQGTIGFQWWESHQMTYVVQQPPASPNVPNFEPPYLEGNGYLNLVQDGQISVTRAPGLPLPPCAGLTPSVTVPGYAVQSDGSLIKCTDWTYVTGGGINYKVLQQFGSSGGAAIYPLNPCVPEGGAEYDDEAFWTAAYDAAVTAGEMPSGLVWNSDYPAVQNWAYSLDETVCTGSGGAVSIAEIITAICARAGLFSIDVTDMEAVNVDGYSIATVTDAASILTPLRSIGFWDAVESGTKLRFQARGKPCVATLTTDDIGAYDSSSSDAQATVPPSMNTVRADISTLPRTIRFHYIATSRDYQGGEQDSPFRLAVSASAVNDVDVNIPVAMGDVQAAQCAEVLWADSWAAQTTQEFSVDQSWLELEPGDCIFVPVDGIETRVRIVSDTNSSGVLRKLSCVRDDQAAVISFAVADPPGFTPQTLTFLSPSDAEYLDLPALQDSDSDPGFYVAVQADPSAGNNWKGCTVYKSIDGGHTFAPAFTMINQTTVGMLEEAVPASEFFTWDNETEIIVNVSSSAMSFESRTDDAVLAGANAAAMGADRRWEIIQFANATQLSPTQWSLTRLLRGRRGTEWVIGTSEVGDAFTLLVAADLDREVLSTAEIGAARVYEPISIGLATGTETTFIGYAMALRPFSPVDPVATWQSGGNIEISWTRRDRLGRTLMSGVDMPLSEATLAFQVDILDHSASPFTVFRTLAATTELAVYTAAEIEADFGSPIPGSLSVRIYQMSAIIGRGTPCISGPLTIEGTPP